jgi:SAM-dependent methyltransferase
MLQGTRGFGHLEKDPKAAEIFNQALVEVTRLTTGLVIANYDFSGFDRIVDVGGGYGELLAAFLHANADASGILFDRPHARDGALERFRSAGLESRFEFVAGDFFEFVPEAADAFVLKNVLHDWGDSDGQKILESCRRAMRPHSRLLIIERLLPTKLERSPAHRDLVRADLTMLVAHGAGERSEADYRRLLDASGFAVNQIVPIGMTFSVIEAQLASG